MSDLKLDIQEAEYLRMDKLEVYNKAIESLRDLKKTQCADGNWNYDPYMHGMANGLILALSLFEEGKVEFLEAPELWLESLPDQEKPIAVCSDEKD